MRLALFLAITAVLCGTGALGLIPEGHYSTWTNFDVLAWVRGFPDIEALSRAEIALALREEGVTGADLEDLDLDFVGSEDHAHVALAFRAHIDALKRTGTYAVPESAADSASPTANPERTHLAPVAALLSDLPPRISTWKKHDVTYWITKLLTGPSQLVAVSGFAGAKVDGRKIFGVDLRLEDPALATDPVVTHAFSTLDRNIQLLKEWDALAMAENPSVWAMGELSEWIDDHVTMADDEAQHIERLIFRYSMGGETFMMLEANAPEDDEFKNRVKDRITEIQGVLRKVRCDFYASVGAACPAMGLYDELDFDADALIAKANDAVAKETGSAHRQFGGHEEAPAGGWSAPAQPPARAERSSPQAWDTAACVEWVLSLSALAARDRETVAQVFRLTGMSGDRLADFELAVGANPPPAKLALRAALSREIENLFAAGASKHHSAWDTEEVLAWVNTLGFGAAASESIGLWFRTAGVDGASLATLDLAVQPYDNRETARMKQDLAVHVVDLLAGGSGSASSSGHPGAAPASPPAVASRGDAFAVVEAWSEADVLTWISSGFATRDKNAGEAALAFLKANHVSGTDLLGGLHIPVERKELGALRNELDAVIAKLAARQVGGSPQQWGVGEVVAWVRLLGLSPDHTERIVAILESYGVTGADLGEIDFVAKDGSDAAKVEAMARMTTMQETIVNAN